jgi:hypothetical protein
MGSDVNMLFSPVREEQETPMRNFGPMSSAPAISIICRRRRGYNEAFCVRYGHKFSIPRARVGKKPGLCWGPSAGIQGALRKVNRFFAFRAGVGAIKFIRKDFNFFVAFRALANKRAQVLIGLKSGTVLRGSLFSTHNDPPWVEFQAR